MKKYISASFEEIEEMEALHTRLYEDLFLPAYDSDFDEPDEDKVEIPLKEFLKIKQDVLTLGYYVNVLAVCVARSKLRKE